MCESTIEAIYPMAMEEIWSTVIGKKKLIWNTLESVTPGCRRIYLSHVKCTA